MDFNSLNFLPLIAAGDLFGILVFVIVAIFSMIGKRFGQQQEEQKASLKPVRQIPPEEPTISPSESKTETPVPSPAEEMRRFLKEMEETMQAKKETPVSPSTTLPSQPPSRKPQIIKRPSRLSPVQPIKVVTPQSTEAKIPREILGGSLRAQIHKEIEQSRQALEQKAKVTTEGFDGTEKSSTTGKIAVSRFDISMLRSATNLKQAVVLSEILGKPRSSSY